MSYIHSANSEEDLQRAIHPASPEQLSLADLVGVTATLIALKTVLPDAVRLAARQ